jgi:hypothetical protein
MTGRLIPKLLSTCLVLTALVAPSLAVAGGSESAGAALVEMAKARKLGNCTLEQTEAPLLWFVIHPAAAKTSVRAPASAAADTPTGAPLPPGPPPSQDGCTFTPEALKRVPLCEKMLVKSVCGGSCGSEVAANLCPKPVLRARGRKIRSARRA